MDLVSVTGALQSIPVGMQTRMQQAVSTLIGEGTKIPRAWISAKAQSITDRAAAEQAMQKALIEVSKKQLKTNDDLINATIDAYLPDIIKKSRNKANVLLESAEIISGGEHHLNDKTIPNTETIDEDWLNLFARQAEDASSDRMRTLLGRILAGEIRQPNSFSPSTLRLVSEMDQEIAADLQRMANLCIQDVIFLDDSWYTGELFAFGSRLALYGFTTGSPSAVQQTFKSNEDGIISLQFDGGTLNIKTVNWCQIEIPVLALTKNAVQLKSILEIPNNSIDRYKTMYKCAKEANLTSVLSGQIVLVSGNIIDL